MSLSKELCLRSDSQNSDLFSDCLVNKFESKEDNYRRDSFDDRFCDDLCEEILQYLYLKDKLKLEGVSKQFQRTVFKRQYKLDINISRETHSWTKDYRHRIYYNFYYYYCIKDQSMHSFKALLKKCPNITSIEFNRHNQYVNYNKLNQVFRLVIENCNNLSEIIVKHEINDSNFEEFHQKFGPKVKYLRFDENLIDFKLFPNIEKLTIICSLPKYKLNDGSFIPQMNLSKMKKLSVELCQGQEHMLRAVIDTFPTLTHLEVYINFLGESQWHYSSEDQNTIYNSMKNISNLKHLIHFKLHNQYEKNNKLICGLLKQMAKNSQNLKSIGCHGFVINERNLEIKQFLSQLRAFSALKRLEMCFYFINNEGEDNIDVNQLFSFELFKGFENITHISLDFVYNWRQTLIESILKDIDINLPKLQYLEIEYRFKTTPEGVQQTAETLSRLSRLETLKLWFRSEVDLKPIKEQITEKCRKIKEIQLYKI